MNKKFIKRNYLIVITCVIILGIVCNPVYIKYQSATSCDLTYSAYRSVQNEISECADYFTSVCLETMGEEYADNHIRILATGENQYTLYLWLSDKGDNLKEIKKITDSSGKIQRNIKKIEDAFNSNAYEVFFKPSMLAFYEFEIVNYEFNIKYLFDAEAGLKGIACSLDGHKPEHYREDGFMYYRLAKNRYGIRKKPFWTPNQEGISQVEVIIPE